MLRRMGRGPSGPKAHHPRAPAANLGLSRWWAGARVWRAGPTLRGISHSSNPNFVSLALLAGLPLSGFGITDDLLTLCIPLDRAAQSHGDVGQVAGRERPVVCVDV